MMSKKEIGMIALAGAGVIGIGYFMGGDALGGGGARAGQILGSPGGLTAESFGSTGVSSPKLAAAAMPMGAKSVVTPQIREEFAAAKVKTVPSKTAYAGYMGGTGPLAYKAPTQFVKPTASTRYEVLASPSTPGRGRLTAKGLTTQAKVKKRQASGFVSYSGKTPSSGYAAALARSG
jgi:hypothetical protein